MEKASILSGDWVKDTARLDAYMRIDRSFDLVRRNMNAGGKKAAIYFVDGFLKDEIMEKLMEFMMGADAAAVSETKNARVFANKFVSYAETETTDDIHKIGTFVLSGAAALMVEGFCECIIIDARTYPTRGVSEPEDDHVLRGSRDGFCETLVFNTALLRRRIRDVKLCVELTAAGTRSKTDIAVCYLDDKADKSFLYEIKEKISKLCLNALPLSAQSLSEAIIKKGTLNPFPKIKFTERPDVAAASVLEGKIIIIVDNSPSVMILPTTIFDFTQEANDYYFPPLIGTYLRTVRMLVFILSLVLTPVWYLLIQNPQVIPQWLSFIKIDEMNSVPIIAQLLIIEFIVDGLKLASLNTPSALAGSFSVVGALILGEFAVSAGLFVPEVILYMSFVAIANYTQPSFELGYAIKLLRIMLIVLIWLLGGWGALIGTVLIIIMLFTNKTVAGTSYMYPLYPFNGRKLLDALIRTKISKFNN